LSGRVTIEERLQKTSTRARRIGRRNKRGAARLSGSRREGSDLTEMGLFRNRGEATWFTKEKSSKTRDNEKMSGRKQFISEI